LHELLQKNSKPKRILVVEGYMDVIALAQFGIHYAVATLGTATSQAHLELLFRFTGEVVLCFDGDKAGREAAWRAMEPAFPCLKDGRQVRIMLLPQNEDPDSLIRKEGETGFDNRLQAAETLSDYFFNQLSSELSLSKLEDRAQLVNKAKPYLDKLPQSVFREMMFARLKELTNYRSLDVSENAAKLKRKYGRKPLQEKGRPSSARTALALLVQNPRLAELIEQKEIDWNELDFPGVELFKDILHEVLANKPANAGALLEIFREKPEEKSVKALALLPLLVPPDGLEAEFSDALERLLAQSRSSVLDKLLTKEQSSGLDKYEKELLRKLLAHTHK
jgi:DNA primase